MWLSYSSACLFVFLYLCLVPTQISFKNPFPHIGLELIVPKSNFRWKLNQGLPGALLGDFIHCCLDPHLSSEMDIDRSFYYSYWIGRKTEAQRLMERTKVTRMKVAELEIKITILWVLGHMTPTLFYNKPVFLLISLGFLEVIFYLYSRTCYFIDF